MPTTLFLRIGDCCYWLLLKMISFIILEPVALQYVYVWRTCLHTLSFHVADRIPSTRRVSVRSAGVGRECSDAASEGRCVWAGRGHTGRMWWRSRLWRRRSPRRKYTSVDEHSILILKVPFLETGARVWDAEHAIKRSCVLGDGCSPRSSAYISARRDFKWPSSRSGCFHCCLLICGVLFSSLGNL